MWPTDYSASISFSISSSFLTKFAVERAAQGEGVGRDLWQALSRDLPSVYWRGRPDNPIAEWYSTLCDGMSRAGPWVVYWRGIEVANIPSIIEEARRRADDFLAIGETER